MFGRATASAVRNGAKPQRVTATKNATDARTDRRGSLVTARDYPSRCDLGNGSERLREDEIRTRLRPHGDLARARVGSPRSRRGRPWAAVSVRGGVGVPGYRAVPTAGPACIRCARFCTTAGCTPSSSRRRSVRISYAIGAIRCTRSRRTATRTRSISRASHSSSTRTCGDPDPRHTIWHA